MGVFDDKKYDELDWISKAVEPLESHITAIFGSMPDEYVFTFEDMNNLVDTAGHNVYASEMVEFVCKKMGLIFTYEEKNFISGFFKSEVAPGTVIDYAKGTLSGSIALRKTCEVIEDAKLIQSFGIKGREAISALNTLDGKEASDRLKEIAELIACKEKLSGRMASKVREVGSRYTEIVQNNEWNIRSSILADKVGLWIHKYVKHGDLSALCNLTKLKVMTHKKLPIYSVEET
jgi:hypothetical protein